MAYFTTKNGIKLYYELKNESQPETLVFLNGVMTSVTAWINQVNLFEKLGFKILLHDFKGQLLSEKPQGPYSFKEHASETKELMDHLGIKKAHLIGTSYGGEVAMQMAIDFPEYAKTISIIDSVSETNEITRLFVEQWKMLAQTRDSGKFFWGMMPVAYGNSFIEKNRKFLEERSVSYNALPDDFYTGQIYLYDTFLKLNITEDLHRIKCPALVVCGSEDIIKPIKFSEVIARNIPNAEFATIPDCGHAAIYEKPGVLNSLLYGFINKNL